MCNVILEDVSSSCLYVKESVGNPELRADTGLRVISHTVITAIGFLLNLNGTEEAKIILHG